MMQIRKMIACLAAVAATSWAGAAFAETIANASFETPTLTDGGYMTASSAYGWTVTTDNVGTARMLNPTEAMYAGAADSGTAPGGDGINVLQTRTTFDPSSAVSTAGKTVFYQNLEGLYFEAGKTYTLTVAIGARYDQTAYPIADDFAISIRTSMATSATAIYKSSTDELTTGAFVDKTVSYTVNEGDAVIGKNVRVMLHAYTDAGHAYNQFLDFDNVRLTVTPEPGAFVLLASSLVGLLAYAWRKRK